MTARLPVGLLAGRCYCGNQLLGEVVLRDFVSSGSVLGGNVLRGGNLCGSVLCGNILCRWYLRESVLCRMSLFGQLLDSERWHGREGI